MVGGTAAAVASAVPTTYLNAKPTTVPPFNVPSVLSLESRACSKPSNHQPHAQPTLANTRNHDPMASDEIGPGGHIVYLTAEQFQEMTKPVFAHHLSQSGRRLLWNLQGPLSSALSVLAEDGNPDGPCEPYLNGNDRHPIGSESITEQPVVTSTVMEENLGDWEDAWCDINYEGFDEDIQPAPEDLPPTFEPLVVTASNGGFVSIHDYVSAVHPWLMARR